MDALLYYDNYVDPISPPWYECCGCARAELPVGGCQCICHEAGREFEDWEEEDEMALTVNGNRTGRAAVIERRDFWEMVEQKRRKAIETAKLDFCDALDALREADPDWEAWFDDDANIPPFIRWTDRAQVDEIIRQMRERAREISIQRGCVCFEKEGDNSDCPVHALIVAHAEAAG